MDAYAPYRKALVQRTISAQAKIFLGRTIDGEPRGDELGSVAGSVHDLDDIAKPRTGTIQVSMS